MRSRASAGATYAGYVTNVGIGISTRSISATGAYSSTPTLPHSSRANGLIATYEVAAGVPSGTGIPIGCASSLTSTGTKTGRGSAAAATTTTTTTAAGASLPAAGARAATGAGSPVPTAATLGSTENKTAPGTASLTATASLSATGQGGGTATPDLVSSLTGAGRGTDGRGAGWVVGRRGPRLDEHLSDATLRSGARDRDRHATCSGSVIVNPGRRPRSILHVFCNTS